MEDGAKKGEAVGGAVNFCVGVADDDDINVSDNDNDDDDDDEGDREADGAVGEGMIVGADDIKYGDDATGDDVAPFGDRVVFGRAITAEGASLIIVITGGSTVLNGATVGSGVGSGVVSAGGIGFSGSGSGPGPGLGSGFGSSILPSTRTFVEVETEVPS